MNKKELLFQLREMQEGFNYLSINLNQLQIQFRNLRLKLIQELEENLPLDINERRSSEHVKD